MKRILKRILKVLAVILVVLLFLITLPLWFRFPNRTDAVFIAQADFQANDFDSSRHEATTEALESAERNFADLTRPVFMSNYHWLKPGSKVALVFLNYYTQPLAIADGNTFRKITVLIPEIKSGSYKIDGTSVKGFVTKGGSSWPRSQCGGEITNGTIEISDVSEDSLQATLKFKADCHDIYQTRTQEISIDESRTFSRLAFEELKPWHGIKGNHVYKETFRKVE